MNLPNAVPSSFSITSVPSVSNTISPAAFIVKSLCDVISLVTNAPLALMFPEAVMCPAGPSILIVELPNCALLANIVALELILPEDVISPRGPFITINELPATPVLINLDPIISPEALILPEAVI